jgi:hypothetical protein
MADKNIAFKLEIDGVEQSIKSVKDLKGAIKALQDEAESADIGSENYKNAIENIEKLNDKLKEVTQTEKQAAQATEDLAKAEKEAAKETQDLRKQFEVLEDELFLLAGQGKQNTAEFKKLTIEAANLNKKIDAVNQSLGGNDTERAAMGFSKLNEGFRNLDFKSVKEGFTMMKTAMAAVGIGLIVQLVTYLITNFDELSKGSGGLAKALRFVGDTIKVILDLGMSMLTFVTDLIGVTSEAERVAEEASIKSAAASKKAIESVTSALNEQTTAYDHQIALLQAAGKGTLELEKEKFDTIWKTNYALTEQLSRRGKLTDAEKEQFTKSLEAMKNAEKQIQILDVQIQKEKDDKAAERSAKYLEKKKSDDAILLAESDAFWKAELALQEEYRKEEYILNKKAIDDQLALEEMQRLQDEAMVAGTQARNEQARLDKIAKDKAARDAELAGYAELEKEKFNLAKQGIDGVQALSDMYFLFKSQKAQKGSKEEAELAKKAFNVNKALQLATATVNGIQAVQGAFATATASPITTVFPVYPFIQAGLAGVLAAANVAKIAASKFDSGASGGGGGGGVSAPSAPAIPAPPIATSANNTNQTTSFDESGKNLDFKQPTINVTATVGVDEIANKTNRVSVLEQQSTF